MDFHIPAWVLLLLGGYVLGFIVGVWVALPEADESDFEEDLVYPRRVKKYGKTYELKEPQ